MNQNRQQDNRLQQQQQPRDHLQNDSRRGSDRRERVPQPLAIET